MVDIFDKASWKNTQGKIRVVSTVLLLLLGVFLALMICNDHFFKYSAGVPGILTGKISDFAYLLFYPAFLIWIFGVRRRFIAVGISIIVALPFIMINLSPVLSTFAENLFSFGTYRIRLWPDPSDCIALLVLPLSVYIGLRLVRFRDKPEALLKTMFILFSLFALVGTSKADSHTPVVMSKEKFRDVSVEIRSPRKIDQRGKIVSYRQYLILCEPNAGFHIIEKKDDGSLLPRSFVFVLGNTDVSIKDDYVFANNLIDLLVFRILPTGDVELVKRMKDALVYDPYASLPPHAFIRNRQHEADPSKIDEVIVGWQ